MNTNYLAIITILLCILSIALSEKTNAYMPKRVTECRNVLYGVSYDEQVKVDKKYHCKKIWDEETRAIIINLPK